MKSVSPSLVPSQIALAPQVQLDLFLFPQAQASFDDGTTFSTEALEQLHFKAGCLPHEQVDF